MLQEFITQWSAQDPDSREHRLLELVADSCSDLSDDETRAVGAALHAALSLRGLSSPSQAVLLNNLGCIEYRRRKFRVAAKHFESAAACEGGIAEASCSTLLNLCAAYSSVKNFVEAAAVANYAVKQCELHPGIIAPTVRSAAYYNLGAALESSGSTSNAVEAFEAAKKIAETELGASHPCVGSAQTAISQIKNRLASRTRTYASKPGSILNIALPIIKRLDQQSSKPRRLPPMHSASPSNILPLSAVKAYTTAAPRSNAIKALSLTLQPLAILSREHKERARSAGELCWNTDPVVGGHELPHRVGKIEKDTEIERVVDQWYIPRHVMSLVQDLKYKETIRRRVIEQGWMGALMKHKKIMALHGVCALEDERRGDLEIDEARTFRVLTTWVQGKLHFLKGSLVYEHEEASLRGQMVSECFRISTTHSLPADLLHLMAQEELNRRGVFQRETQGRSAVRLAEEGALATTKLKDTLRGGKRGIASALAVWCLESVLGDKLAVETLRDESYRNSLHVLERYAMFGQPSSPLNTPV